MGSLLAGKRVLVTAGPTWVAVDPVRYLGNRSSGALGLAFAREAEARGAAVTLLYGPAEAPLPPDAESRWEVHRFTWLEELQELVTGSAARRAEVIVHAAAVADYRPVERQAAKIDSGAEEWSLRLVRTPKLIDRLRHVAPHAVLVGFKLTAGVPMAECVRRAEALRTRVGAELVVGNRAEEVSAAGHLAHLVREGREPLAMSGKEEIARLTLDAVEEELARR